MINKQFTGSPLQKTSIKVSEIIKPYRFINAKGAHCGETDVPIGTSEKNWKVGDIASAITYGIVLLECQDAIQIGEKIQVSNDGGKASRHTSGLFVATALSNGDAGGIIKAKLVV